MGRKEAAIAFIDAYFNLFGFIMGASMVIGILFVIVYVTGEQANGGSCSKSYKEGFHTGMAFGIIVTVFVECFILYTMKAINETAAKHEEEVSSECPYIYTETSYEDMIKDIENTFKLK